MIFILILGFQIISLCIIVLCYLFVNKVIFGIKTIMFLIDDVIFSIYIYIYIYICHSRQFLLFRFQFHGKTNSI